MSKKIMFSLSVLAGGGAERVVSVWASELAERGYDVSILLSGHVEQEYQISEKVRIYAVEAQHADYKKLNTIQKISKRRGILKQEKPDYLISLLPHNQLLSLVAAIGLKIRRIECVRISPWNAAMARNILKKWLWKLCFFTAYKVILQVSDQASFFGKSIRKKAVVIPNPISEIYVKNYKTDFSKEAQRFVAAGRISNQKNYPLMLQGFAKAVKEHADDARYANIRLDIYGAEDGGSIHDLQQRIQELDMEEHIFFRGKTSQLYKEYCASDVYLLSSDFEGLPNALIEAMASCLLCISTDCRTGPRDLITQGENGYLVPVGDVDGFAKAVETAVELPYEERVRMGLAAREKIMIFCGEEQSLKKLESLFE